MTEKVWLSESSPRGELHLLREPALREAGSVPCAALRWLYGCSRAGAGRSHKNQRTTFFSGSEKASEGSCEERYMLVAGSSVSAFSDVFGIAAPTHG